MPTRLLQACTMGTFMRAASRERARRIRKELRRRARACGVSSMDNECCDAALKDMSKFLERIITDAVLHTERCGRTTVSAKDVLHALNLRGEDVTPVADPPADD